MGKVTQYEPYYYMAQKLSGDEGVRTQTQALLGSESVSLGMPLAGSAQERKMAADIVSEQRNYNKTVSQPPLPQDGPVVIIEPTLPATADSERIIRTGTVLLEVEDGEKAYQKALAIAQELGGYIASSNFYKDRDNRQSGTITIRVPKDKFAPALERFGSLGKVENVLTDSRDVTQEYANLHSQLDVAMVAYKKMLEALQKKQVTIPEAMRIESELTPVLRRVQQLKNQIEALNNVISYPTITLNFHEAAVSVKFLKESTRYIKESLITAGITAVRIAAAAIPVAVVLLIAGAILFAVVFWIIRVFKRK
jgi:hypothetical protein